MIYAGQMNDLKVLRKSDIGYMLSDGKTEILLHFNETNDTELNNGDNVGVFVYYDKKHRLCATLNKPNVLISKPGFATVVGSISNVGVFVDINCGKDILVSKDYLPYDYNLWPQIDDVLIIELKEKKESLVAKPLNKFDIIALTNSEVKYAVDEQVEGYVCRTGNEGVGIVTKDFAYIFVHKTHLRNNYRLGELVNPKIILVKKDEYNATLTQNKEYMIDGDEIIIVNYMKKHGNKMKITAKTSSDIVERELKLSRKAFKRALGSLYKAHKVYFEDDYTILSDEKKEL